MSKLHLILAGALCAFTAAQLSAMDIPAQYDTGGFALGCQAWTFNDFTAFEAIDKTVEAGGKVIEFYPGQKLSSDRPGAKLDHHMSDQDLDALKAKLTQAGIIAVRVAPDFRVRQEAQLLRRHHRIGRPIGHH